MMDARVSPQPNSLEDFASQPLTAAEALDPPVDVIERQVNISRRVGVAAGVALAITSGAIAQTAKPPQYESKFELETQPTIRDNRSNSVSQQVSRPTISETEINDQIRILRSPMLVEPVVKRLQTQVPNLTISSLREHLQIDVGENQKLEIRYRDTDPQTAQLVSEQLAQAYQEYSQSCQGVCRGVTFIEQQIPKLQQRINQRRTEVQQFFQQHGLSNPDTQTRSISARITSVSKQKAEVENRIFQTQQQYMELQNRMALQPNETIAISILNQDPRYQELLRQLGAVDRQLAIEFGRLAINNSQIQKLSRQHEILLGQLHQQAQQALDQYLVNPSLQNSMFQEPTAQTLLQQSVLTVHYLQILEINQQAIGQTESLLQQQENHMASLLKHHANLQQKLHADSRILQQYLDRLEILAAQPTQQNTWQVVSPPQTIEIQTRQLTSFRTAILNLLESIATVLPADY